MIEHAPLQSVYIYFDTATYDEIERDIKVQRPHSLYLCVKTFLLVKTAYFTFYGYFWVGNPARVKRGKAGIWHLVSDSDW